MGEVGENGYIEKNGSYYLQRNSYYDVFWKYVKECNDCQNKFFCEIGSVNDS